MSNDDADYRIMRRGSWKWEPVFDFQLKEFLWELVPETRRSYVTLSSDSRRRLRHYDDQLDRGGVVVTQSATIRKVRR